MKKAIVLIVLFMIPLEGMAQERSNTGWGVTFTVPPGWVDRYDEQADGYLFQASQLHNAVMALHPIDEIGLLKQALQKMARRDFGDAVTFSEFEDLEGGLSGQVSGELDGHSLKGEVIGLLSPYGGGVLILEFVVNLDQPPSFARRLVETLDFQKPEIDADWSSRLDGWKNDLNNTRLSYYESYSSQDGVGGYTGYRDKTVIDLCAPGFFKFNFSSELAVDTGTQGLANMDEQRRGNGLWEVRRLGNRFILKLKFYSGKVDFLILNRETDEIVYLDDQRFIRTTERHTKDQRPHCDEN